ncbi:MAG TPA: MmgE/PrpD family protein, partial [Solirubrobacterales bacterium]|nr:MmgE/PrpD family protein [Solirubrobacterales bacterium]
MRLAAWASALRLEDVPAPVVTAAKLHLLDAFGTGLAALELGAIAAPAAVAGQLGGEPEATALGVGRPVGAAPAALANGAWIHALDFDDTHEATLVHSSAVVAPAMLAVGEAVGAGGEELLAAALAGYEVGARVGLGARGSLHRRGFHPTSVCGVFAAATVAAKLRGLGPER